MKDAKNGNLKKTIKNNSKTKIINLKNKDQLLTELEYEKYYNRIKRLSQGL